jgi:hypothetical protein
MRIIHPSFSFKKMVFSKVASIFYLLVTLFFLYKIFFLFPAWYATKEASIEAVLELDKRNKDFLKREEALKNQETNLGQERYQKDFFNKLEEGEELIILYSETDIEERQTEFERKMFWWEEWKQNLVVWWRNLEIYSLK